jgi:hypothetical protein
MGQKRTLFTVPFYVCFAPEGGHSDYRDSMSLSAISGHRGYLLSFVDSKTLDVPRFRFSPMRLLLVADLHYSLRQFDWVLDNAARFDVVVIAGDHLDLSSIVDGRAQSVVVG